MVEVKKVSASVYSEVLKKQNFRYFLNQMSEYGQLKEKEGNKVEYLLFFEQEKCIGLALVVYYSIKKIFSWGNCIFGPICAKEDFEKVLKALQKQVFLNWRVQALRVNPTFLETSYQDLTVVGEDLSVTEQKILETLHFERLEKEWYEDGSVHPRCVYNKVIQGQSIEEVAKTFDQTLKRKLKKAKELKVQIELLSFEQLEIFNEMFNAMAERKDSLISLRADQIEHFYTSFGEKIFFPAAYIEKRDFDTYFFEQKEKIKKEEDKLLKNLEKQEKNALLLQEKENQKQKLNQMSLAFESVLKEQKAKFSSLKNAKEERLYLSAACFIASGKDFIFYMGGGPKHLMDFQGTYAIHEAMIQKAIAENFENYNLYGCSDKLDEQDENYGILKFKRQFRGNFEKYIGTYVYKRKFSKLLGF